jgi:NO-binding membrane sensor protein with MHYT domain/nitrogen-specific signal transduction histidine kinase/CheY-like chemotaxis protein
LDTVAHYTKRMLTGSFDPTFVVLSIVIATMASYSALDLAGRVTAATGFARGGWLAGGAAVMGLGIWSMHFVGMLAFHLPMPIAYQLPLMLLSVVVAIAASLLALTVVSRPALRGPTLLIAGVLMGAAISGMHYVGMASMYVAGTSLGYSASIVVLSIIIAVVASLAALWLAFRFRAVTTRRGRWLKALSAVVMGIAISGMHYTGMAGAHFSMSHAVAPPATIVLATGQLGAAIVVGALLMIVLALIGGVIDRAIETRAVFTARLAEINVRLQRSLDEAEQARQQREVSEQALRESQEQLRMSQKMDAIGNLAGGIAHDFNNLLTVIRLNAEALFADLPKERRADHQEVMTAVHRATTLTKQLLAYGRRQLLNPAPVSLNDLVTSTDTMLRRVIPKDIEINLDLAPTGGFALADRGQLEQVLLNLVVNAKDAMPSGGRLVVETRNVTLAANTAGRPATLKAGDYVTLTVRDTGSGMTPEVLSQAFEPYFTTKGEGKGSGLGLSMVYGLVRQSSGDLTIESTPGVGTVIRIFLPRVADSLAADPSPPAEAVPAPVNDTILLVEDEPALRRVVSKMLRAAGYSVHEAENGQDALIRYLHQLDDIDLVLSDLIMPQMGGIELVKRFRARRPGIRVLFMSGYSEEALTSAGALLAPLIQKPFTMTDLTAAIRVVLDAGLTSSPSSVRESLSKR